MTQRMKEDDVAKEDPHSSLSLKFVLTPDEVLKHRLPQVQTVLVVLSARGMVFDCSALRQQIQFTYPKAQVYFLASASDRFHKSGTVFPKTFDLVIDFTAPEVSSCWESLCLSRKARFIVGREGSWVKRQRYQRLVKETPLRAIAVPQLLDYERSIQKQVLGLAGIFFTQSAVSAPDRSHQMALQLPGMRGL